MTTYLIQRARFQNNGGSGIDSILQFEYMGSAEFEFGALPSSLKAIRKSPNEYTYLDMDINGKAITVYCHDSQMTEVKTYLTKLSENKIRLKEHSNFPEFINQSGIAYRTDFWWDLENNLMFWKKNPEFEAKFKTLIQPK